jgi:phosphoribosylpyrophosphate synthetase
MRGVQIFSGNSHPALTETICERLGTSPAPADLGKFANGETMVNIGASVRNQDVYIVQSGSSKINDSVMELLIMISACKGGSAKSITGMSSLLSPTQENTIQNRLTDVFFLSSSGHAVCCLLCLNYEYVNTGC